MSSSQEKYFNIINKIDKDKPSNDLDEILNIRYNIKHYKYDDNKYLIILRNDYESASFDYDAGSPSPHLELLRGTLYEYPINFNNDNVIAKNKNGDETNYFNTYLIGYNIDEICESIMYDKFCSFSNFDNYISRFLLEDKVEFVKFYPQLNEFTSKSTIFELVKNYVEDFGKNNIACAIIEHKQISSCEYNINIIGYEDHIDVEKIFKAKIINPQAFDNAGTINLVDTLQKKINELEKEQEHIEDEPDLISSDVKSTNSSTSEDMPEISCDVWYIDFTYNIDTNVLTLVSNTRIIDKNCYLEKDNDDNSEEKNYKFLSQEDIDRVYYKNPLGELFRTKYLPYPKSKYSRCGCDFIQMIDEIFIAKPTIIIPVEKL